MSAGSAPRELELKFQLDDAARTRLAGAGLSPQAATSVKRLTSTYWDTPDGVLLAAHVALRVRRTPDGWVQTVKAEGDGPFDRFEWEAPVSSEHPERAALPPETTPPGKVVHAALDRLAPMFTTDFERTAWRLVPNAALQVEVAMDLGEVRADGAEPRRIAEFEAECLSGTPIAFWQWATRFAARHRLRLGYATKNERGLRLAGRLPALPTPVKAAEVEGAGRAVPDPDATAAVAAARAARACIAHFAANVDPLLETEHPSAAHQLRVALRRLRAVVRFFGLGAIDPGWQEVETQARALADAAGKLRDADVFAAGTLAALREALPGDPAIDALGAALSRAQQIDRAAAREMVRGVAATRLVLQAMLLAARLERAPSRRRATPPLDARRQRFGDFAALQVADAHARLRKRAKRADDAESWHRARISGKNLRYAIEFAETALPKPRQVRQAAERLAELQELLGAANDAEVAAGVAARLLRSEADQAIGSVDATRAVALIEGWAAHGRAMQGRKMEERARKLVARLGDDLARTLERAEALRVLHEEQARLAAAGAA